MKTSLDKDSVRLAHMLDSIDEALLFAKGRSRNDLDDDRMLTLALLKTLEMIGEAASKITDDFKNRNPDVLWDAVIATRNRLIHGYFDIDLDIVWVTIRKDLPMLRRALRKCR